MRVGIENITFMTEAKKVLATETNVTRDTTTRLLLVILYVPSVDLSSVCKNLAGLRSCNIVNIVASGMKDLKATNLLIARKLLPRAIKHWAQLPLVQWPIYNFMQIRSHSQVFHSSTAEVNHTMDHLWLLLL